MTWWKRLVGGSPETDRIDYYREALALAEAGSLHEALTSFRLALKESPGDIVILQQIAITYTRIGMTEEAEKTYRHVLQKEAGAAGAHYGLAFLLVHRGEHGDAIHHLNAFLDNAPADPDAAEHVRHARDTLAKLMTQSEQNVSASESA
jgi:predicted Zn-dependent protease